MGRERIASGQSYEATYNRTNPLQKFKFLVEIDNFSKSGFQKCSGLEKKVNVVEYRDGGDNNSKRKELGWVDYPNITLSRGMSRDKDMAVWADQCMNINGITCEADIAKRDISIILQTPNGKPARQWEVYDCMICDYKFDDLDAESDDFLIESMEIANEGWEEISI